MARYLFDVVDDNICLYRGYKFSNATFEDKDLTAVDLNSFCNYEENEFCYNVLRFPDRENHGKIKDFWENFNGKF